MQAATTAQDQICLLELILPEHANRNGTLYGANALQLLGKAAYICATRHTRCAVVMAKADNIEFVHPIPVGAIIETRARVVFQGHASITVTAEIVANSADPVETAPSVTARFMLVAVDEHGAPIPIPDHYCAKEPLS